MRGESANALPVLLLLDSRKDEATDDGHEYVCSGGVVQHVLPDADVVRCC